jgi:tRNA G46 methylase TrmB
MSQELADELYKQDRYYASHWQKEADFWEQAGLYSGLTEGIELPEEGTHVDACTGRGDLLIELQRKFNRASLIGTEIKIPLLEDGIAKMKEESIRGVSYADYEVRIDHEN